MKLFARAKDPKKDEKRREAPKKKYACLSYEIISLEKDAAKK